MIHNECEDIFYGDISCLGMTRERGHEEKLLIRTINGGVRPFDYRRECIVNWVVDVRLYKGNVIINFIKSRYNYNNIHEKIIEYFLKTNLSRKMSIIDAKVLELKNCENVYIISDPEFVTYCILRYNLREHE